MLLLAVAALSGSMPFTVDTRLFSSQFARTGFAAQLWYCLIFNSFMAAIALFGNEEALRKSVKGSWIIALTLVMAVAYWYLEKHIGKSDVYMFLQAQFGMVLQLYLWPIYYVWKSAYHRLCAVP